MSPICGIILMYCAGMRSGRIANDLSKQMLETLGTLWTEVSD